ncbi:MAG: hypothetical protein ACLUYK_02805 [Eggerthella lenta]
MSIKGSQLAVCVCVWMACLPPMRRNSPTVSFGITWGSTHTGHADNPAASHASLVN